MALVYVNGSLVDEAEARISTFDHGLIVGDGAFETVLLFDGRPFALKRHLARLDASLSGLKLARVDHARVNDAIDSVLEHLDYQQGRIRITVTGGHGPLGSGRLPSEPSLVVATAPLTEVHENAQVEVVPWPRNEHGALVGLKTISYAENAVALAYVNARDADEAIFANIAGNLCEGSGSNVFVVIGDEVTTPPLAAGCLAGITRGLVLEHSIAREHDIPIDDFQPGRIDEAFLTSAIRGVQSITKINGHDVLIGPLTLKIKEDFETLRREVREP
ncbi:MAG TPA: aminotransferase class IV [Acidimicrobiales bacterium]|nr:aminotransferase class IV [Acidimicrobiales bacterium]